MRGRAKREPLRCRARPALWTGSRAFAFCSLAPLWFSAWNFGPRLLLAPGLILVRVCGTCRSPGLSGVSDLQGSLRFLFSSALGVTGWWEQSIPCLTVPLGQQLWLEASDPAMWKSSQCGCRSPCSPVLTVPWAAPTMGVPRHFPGLVRAVGPKGPSRCGGSVPVLGLAVPGGGQESLVGGTWTGNPERLSPVSAGAVAAEWQGGGVELRPQLGGSVRVGVSG